MKAEEIARRIVVRMGVPTSFLDDFDWAVLITNIHIMKYNRCSFPSSVRRMYADGEYVSEHSARTPYHYDYLNKRLQQIWNNFTSSKTGVT